MHAMGIDIGTTTISIVMVDEDSGAVIARDTISHTSWINDGCAVGKTQDPEVIRSLALNAAQRMIREHGALSCIGLTGQMHGMLYLDAAGQAVSPLYTWQDGRGNIPLQDGRTAVECLRSAGCAAASGYGLTTHFALQRAGQIPADAVCMTTISDYVGMGITGATKPVLSADMAASWGAFDLKARRFQRELLEKLGIDTRPLPKVGSGYEVVGETSEGIPVCCSLGDNQASVLGSVQQLSDTMLINIGTGSQVSMGVDHFVDCAGSIELRPCGADGYILVGSGLCGGRAYAMLERFYREVSGVKEPRYEVMLAQARQFIETNGLDAAWRVRTAFSGTRDDPNERGSISGIGIDNFQPGALTAGVIEGILGELSESYDAMCAITGNSARRLVGSGNGLRRNPLMQSIAEQIFDLKLQIPAHLEEAAFGAALCAMAASGRKSSFAEAQRLIHYQ